MEINKLNMGCGNRLIKDAINLDIVKLEGVDVVHDLEKPLPFEDNYFDEIYANSILEHIENFMGLMEEIYRILKPDGLLYAEVPYYMHKDTYTDPTHKRGFTDKSFQYFEEDNELNFYTNARFSIEQIKKIINNKHLYSLIPFKKLFGFLLWNLISSIHFKLRALK